MPGWLEPLFAGGRIAELAMAVLVVEGALLAWLVQSAAWRRLLLVNALAGLALLGALRAALLDAGPVWLALWLAAGLAAHLADVILRLKQARAGRPKPRAP